MGESESVIVLRNWVLPPSRNIITCHNIAFVVSFIDVFPYTDQDGD